MNLGDGQRVQGAATHAENQGIGGMNALYSRTQQATEMVVQKIYRQNLR